MPSYSPCSLAEFPTSMSTTKEQYEGTGLISREAGEKHLCQDKAVMVQDGVAALSERGLSAEVGYDVDEPVPEVGYLQPCRNVLHQPQRVYIAPDVVQQSSCTRKAGSSRACTRHSIHGGKRSRNLKSLHYVRLSAT